MTDVTVDFDGLKIGTYDPARVNGHIVSYGVHFDSLEYVCMGCEKHVEVDAELLHRVPEYHEPVVLLSHFSRFVEEPCSEDYDSIEEVVNEKVMMRYMGRPANDNTIREMKEDLSTIMAVPADVSVDI